MPDEVCDQDAAIERARDRLVSAWSAQCESDGRLRVVLGTIDGVSFVIAVTPSDQRVCRMIVNTFRRLEGRRPLRCEGTLHSRSITRDLALKIADELVAADRRRRARQSPTRVP
jgi:hypothetical protein